MTISAREWPRLRRLLESVVLSTLRTEGWSLSPEDVEDAVQDAAVRVLAGYDEERGPPEPFAALCAERAACELVRRRARRAAYHAAWPEGWEPEDVPEEPTLEVIDVEHLVCVALEVMPEKSRSVVVRLLGGETGRAIARTAGLDPAQISRRQAEGIAAARAVLVEGEEMPPVQLLLL